MPSSKEVTVERIVNGARDLRFSEQIPASHELVVQEADDHTHIVIGSPADLEAAGVTKPKPKRKPAAKKPAAKKPAAKKSTAKRK